MITLRPFGPSVTFTASARMSMPRNMRLRASSPKRTSLAAMCLFLSFLRSGGFGERRCAFDNAEQVALLHDQELFAVQLHLGPRPLAEQHAVPGLDVELDEHALLVPCSGPGGDHLALHRLFLDRVGDDDPALGLLVRGDAADDDPVVQRAKFHALAPKEGR